MATTKKAKTQTRAYCRFSPEEKAIVQRMMKEHGVSEAEAIRRLVRMSDSTSEVVLELSIMKHMIERMWKDLGERIERLEKTPAGGANAQGGVGAGLKERLKNI